jgi:hypothetical protein
MIPTKIWYPPEASALIRFVEQIATAFLSRGRLFEQRALLH